MQKLALFMLILLVALPISAQDDDENSRVFTSNSEPRFSFIYPVDWVIEVDGPFTYFAEGDDSTAYIQIVPAADDPFTINALDSETAEPDFSPAAILTYYFGEAGYSEPETTTYDLDDDETAREIAVISDEIEDVYAFYVTPDYFALVFFSGEDRAADADAIETLITSMVLGRIEITRTTNDTTSDGPTVDFSAGTATVSAELPDGTFSVDYPADLTAEVLDASVFITNDDETFFVLVTADLNFAFDLFGGEGNPSTIETPRELLEAILGGAAINTEDAALVIEDTTINGTPGVIFLESDEISDLALLAFALDSGELVLALASVDIGTFDAQRSIIEAIIGSARVD